MKLISLVIPCYNEESGVELLYKTVLEALCPLEGKAQLEFRFVDDGSRDSYALKRGSPAREKGLVQDWMTGALDIRNDESYPRLREGKVDIGCYECWLDPAGTQMIIR